MIFVPHCASIQDYDIGILSSLVLFSIGFSLLCYWAGYLRGKKR